MERSEEVQAKLSASKLEASSLCPAFFQASKKFSWYGDRDSASEGTIRHEHEENQTPWKRLMTMSGESVRIAPESLWQNAEKKFLVMKRVSSLGKQDIGMMTCGVVSWTIWRH